MQNFNIFRLIVTAIFMIATIAGVSAQDNPGIAFAGVQNGNLTIFGVGDAPLTINNPPNKGISGIAWSPDGNKLAYILADEQFQAGLYVVDVTTSVEPVKLEAGAFAAGFPLTFTADGQILYIGQAAVPSDPSVAPQVAVMQIAPEAGAQPQTLGTFDFGQGCGGGSSYPAYWRYWEDAGFGGSALKLIPTDYGLLHNSNCSGSGLALLNWQTGQTTPIGTADVLATDGGLGRFVLSPDGRTVAAVKTRQTSESKSPFIRSLALIDLATLTISDVQTTGQPDQLAWSNDGTSIFYSAITETGNLIEGLNADQLSRITPMLGFDQNGNPYPVPAYQSTIHQYNVGTGEETLIYTADAFAFGRMTATPDGQHLIASQIANLNAWVTAIADGTLDVSSGMPNMDQTSFVPLTLYR
ncbi:MAG: hypothetical protein K8I30_06310, partial [Anaerolineae bacterium]|nr:hypothetical protein [Anaerolineae bacterium]